MDAQLIGIDLSRFLPVQNAFATKHTPAKPPQPSAQSDMIAKEASTKGH
jgi:hypothetical protein